MKKSTALFTQVSYKDLKKMLNLYSWGVYNEEKIMVVYKQAKLDTMTYATEVRDELYSKNVSNC